MKHRGKYDSIRDHSGFDYESTGLIKKMTSPRMWEVSVISAFMLHIDSMMISLLKMCKSIQFFYTYAVDKDDTSINL